MALDRLSAAWQQYQQRARAGVSVLVIDDEPAVVEVLVEMLATEGYPATKAYDLASGRDLALQGTFDLIVSDKNLPDGTGVDLIRELREKGVDTPFVLITGFASADTVVDAMTAGAADYIAKPFDDITHVMARLTSVIDRRLADRLNSKMVEDLTKSLQEEQGDKKLVIELARQLFGFKQDLAHRPAVLVVEDKPAVAEVIRRSLEQVKLPTEIATDIESARAWIQRPDGPLTALVSVDIPSSLKLVRDLCATDPLLQVVVTSGVSDTELALGAVAMGAVDYVIRSFEGVEVLRSRMQRAVSHARRRRLYTHLIATLYRAARAAGDTATERFLAAMDTNVEDSKPVETVVEIEPEDVDITDLFEPDAEVPVPVSPPPQPDFEVRSPGPKDGDLRLIGGEPHDGFDRRASRRVEAMLEVRFRTAEDSSEFLYSHLRDISAGGLFIRMDEPLAVGARVAIEILVGWNRDPVRVFGEVVRQARGDAEHPGWSGIGVKLNGEAKEELSALVDDLARRLVPG